MPFGTESMSFFAGRMKHFESFRTNIFLSILHKHASFESQAAD